jgi:ankyrin repeat protein
MEEVLSRFPHLGVKIFVQLIDKDLQNCQKVSTSWNTFINNQRFSSIRIIKNHIKKVNKNYNASPKKWQHMFQGIETETVKKFALEITKYPFSHMNSTLMHLVLEYQRIFEENDELVQIIKAIFATIEKDDDRNPEDRLGITPLHIAVEIQNFAVFQEIAKNCTDIAPKNIAWYTPLHFAARCGNLPTCKFLIDHVENINPETKESKQTPLHFASENGHLEIVKMFIQHPKINKNHRNIMGQTSLHLAAEKGNFQICKYIIENRSKINPVDEVKKTPLHHAAEKGHLEVYKMMIKHPKINKNPRSLMGQTPLHFAAKNGNYQVCKFAIQNGSKINLVDVYGKTPFHYAAENEHFEVYEMMFRNSPERWQ